MPSAQRPQTPASPPGAGPPWRRGLAFVLLASAVLAVHGWLLKAPATGWGRPLPRPGPKTDGGARAMQVVGPPAVATPGATPGAPPVEAAPGPLRATPRALPSQPWPRLKPELTPERPAGQPPPPRPDDGDEPVIGQPGAGSGAVAAAPQPPVAPAPVRVSQEQDERGRPPPVYETRVPPVRHLHYRAERGGTSGTAVLAWEPGPAGYTLQLQVHLPSGPQVDWRSQGGFDRDGLSPMRMVERQKQGDRHAVNFQRDKGVISFAGPSREEPLWRGAQDRLSSLIQLSAVALARQGAPALGEAVRMQVATPRGDVDEWLFTLQDTEPLEAAGRRWSAQRWVREPTRPYDQRVEVWLAPGAGPLPLGLRWTTVPGGEPLALWLDEAPGADR